MRPCCYICHCSDKCAYILSFAVQVKDVMKDVMADLQQTNSEKILLSWVRQSTKNYKDLNVVNFSSSWADGFAFNALIHSHRCVFYFFFGVLFWKSQKSLVSRLMKLKMNVLYSLVINCMVEYWLGLKQIFEADYGLLFFYFSV